MNTLSTRKSIKKKVQIHDNKAFEDDIQHIDDDSNIDEAASIKVTDLDAKSETDDFECFTIDSEDQNPINHTNETIMNIINNDINQNTATAATIATTANLSGSIDNGNNIDENANNNNNNNNNRPRITINNPTRKSRATAFIIGIKIKKETILNMMKKQFNENRNFLNMIFYVLIHCILIAYFAYATYYFINQQYLNFASTCDHDHDDTINTNSSGDASCNETEPEAKYNDTNGRCRGACGFQWCNGYGMLLIIYVFAYTALLYSFYLKSFISFISKFLNGINLFKVMTKFLKTCYIGLITLAIIGFCLFLYFETRGSEERLLSLMAPLIFIICGYIFSTDRNKINWKTVIVGITSQFVLGLFCIRWEIGRKIFQCIGDKLSVFMPLSNQGGQFVYGPKLINDQVFAFATLPVIYFFSCLISILYYFGIMQCIVAKIGWLLQKLLNTTVCESVNSAGNIFLGMSESPLLIRPYIQYLTKSELHSIMVSGFATVSGTVFAAYMSFGANPAHLITSTVMAAPAALAFSKLYYPETEESKTRSDNIELKKSDDSSVMDAATNGAQSATAIILGIIGNIIAFIALIALLNTFVNWLGYLVGLDDLTFEWIFSKLFIPLCICLGVPLEDCNIIAQVIAKKTVINEFVAFKQLGEFHKAGKISSIRSVGIATFAICGFANPSSLGIYIGMLTSLCPAQRKNITAVALRSCIVGSIVCFVSAGFAGLLMDNEALTGLNSNSTNMLSQF